MSVYPIVLNNVLPLEGFEIMIQIPLLVADWEKNGATHLFEAWDDVLEIIAVFESG